MNQRNNALKFQVAKRVVAHGTRGFGGQAFVPVIGMHSISDFDFFDAIDVVVIEAALSSQRVRRSRST